MYKRRPKNGAGRDQKCIIKTAAEYQPRLRLPCVITGKRAFLSHFVTKDIYRNKK